MTIGLWQPERPETTGVQLLTRIGFWPAAHKEVRWTGSPFSPIAASLWPFTFCYELRNKLLLPLPCYCYLLQTANRKLHTRHPPLPDHHPDLIHQRQPRKMHIHNTFG